MSFVEVFWGDLVEIQRACLNGRYTAQVRIYRIYSLCSLGDKQAELVDTGVSVG